MPEYGIITCAFTAADSFAPDPHGTARPFYIRQFHSGAVVLDESGYERHRYSRFLSDHANHYAEKIES